MTNKVQETQCKIINYYPCDDFISLKEGFLRLFYSCKYSTLFWSKVSVYFWRVLQICNDNW